jgi:hypothetical protein
MVTYEQLREHFGRRPFRPFRLVLKNGESVDISRTNQAATMERRVFVGDNTRYRWIWHDQIERVDVAEFEAA